MCTPFVDVPAAVVADLTDERTGMRIYHEGLPPAYWRALNQATPRREVPRASCPNCGAPHEPVCSYCKTVS